MPAVSTFAARPNAGLARLLGDLPDDVRRSFSDRQLTELARAADSQSQRHLIDYRVSVPLPFGRRYYVALLVGRERRNQARLVREGQARIGRIAILYAVLTAAVAGMMLTSILAAVCVLNALSGDGIFTGESPPTQLPRLMQSF